jgi:predicted nucleotidyltransferase
MEENTYLQVFHYIENSSQPVSPHELSRETQKSRVSVHTALKRLIKNGDIEKHGVSPRVTYTVKSQTAVTPENLSISIIQEKLAPIFKKNSITYAGIFGFDEHKTLTPESTIDIMISAHQPLSFRTIAVIEHALAEALGVKVTLATDQGANKFIKSSMMKGLRVIYGSI